ncbi:hypothetical protein JCM3770_006292 [Rhodotorula araucariae]
MSRASILGPFRLGGIAVGPEVGRGELDQRDAFERRTTISCTAASDCVAAAYAIPANSHYKCNKARGTCTYGCNAGFALRGSSCTRTATSTTATATSKTSGAGPTSAPITCSATVDCTAAKAPIPANAHQLCKSKVCTWACNSRYTSSATACFASTTASMTTTKSTSTTAATTKTASSATSSATSSASSSSSPAATTSAPLSNSSMTTTSASSSSTSSGCAPKYTAYATTIKGTGTLPKPTAFVQRAANSQKLTVSGKEYRIVGPNIYWLCQDENYGPVGSPPDKGRVREALAMAVAMGATTIRAHSCGISVGPSNPYNLESQANMFNYSAWDARDYALFAAREYGLRVILPLTDNWAYYHGGKYDFLDFTGLSKDNKGEQFFTAKAAIAAYGVYITEFLSHYNPYTGKFYYDDPTILGWETGNELGGYINAEMYPPASWTQQVINYIRALDSHHLIIDGTNGFWNYTTGASAPGLNISGIDIVSDHGYPRNTGILTKEIELAKAAGKAFFIGEYDWTPTSSVPLSDYHAQIEKSGSYMGDMIWSLFGKDPQCCNFVKHGNGFSMYYPNGGTSAEQNNTLAVVQHWARMQGKPVPTVLPAVACPQPVF